MLFRSSIEYGLLNLFFVSSIVVLSTLPMPGILCPSQALEQKA